MGCCLHLCRKLFQKNTNDDIKESIKLIIDDSYGREMSIPEIQENFGAYEENEEDISDSDNDNDDNDIDKHYKKTVKKHRKYFIISFGQNFQEKYRPFLDAFERIFDFFFRLRTTFYTMKYEDVKKIITDLISKKYKGPIISDKLYNFVVDISKKIKKEYYYEENNYKLFQELFLINTEFQTEMIISTINLRIINMQFNKNNITYSLINYFQDIGFCVRILFYSLDDYLLREDFLGYEYNFDIRILYYLNLFEYVTNQSKIPADLFKIATESARIKDTIIIGDKQFRKHIKGLNLPCIRINDLDDNMFDLFFKKPYKEKNQYKVVKYFVVCDENLEKKYLDIFKNLSSKYGFAYLFLIYVKNKNIIDIKNELRKESSIIYFFDDYQLLHIFKDNNENLMPFMDSFIDWNYEPLQIKDIEDFKSTCEDGWDLFDYKKDNYHFDDTEEIGSFYNFVMKIFNNIFESYMEHDSLKVFLEYYSNYFFLALQPEFIVNMTAYAKMFLYAYTLDEGNPNKNFYCILNDDLRSSNPKKINRHIDIIRLIGGLIQAQKLKFYNGYVYRASFLKDELIKKIKPGLTITNSAFWSSTKKESVAKKFLNTKYKNALIITKGGLKNNVDIHLEEISRYPNEEEVLFLPFCNFKIKSFQKVKKDNLSYYELVLENESDSSLIQPLKEKRIQKLNFERKLYKDIIINV